MAVRIWDPYKIFNITTRNSQNMFCVGQAMSKGGARCRFRIEGRVFTEVISILDEMSTKPPDKVHALLPRLARSSLCEEFHQHQVDDIQEKWEDLLIDVVKQYEKAKRLKKLEERNNELNSRLSEQTEKVRRLERLLEAESKDDEERTTKLHNMKSQLDEALTKSNRYIAEAETWKATLLMQKFQLETLLADCTRRSEQLAINLDRETTEKEGLAKQVRAKVEALGKYEVEAEARHAFLSRVADALRNQLAEERQTLVICRNELEGLSNNYTALKCKADELQSNLAEEGQKSEIFRCDIEVMRSDRTNLFAEAQNLQRLLSAEHQNTEQLKKSLGDATMSQATHFDEMRLLQNQLETASQDLHTLKEDLAESETNKSTLRQDIEVLQSKTAIEHQLIEHLRHEWTTITEEKAALVVQLKDTRSTLEQSQLKLTDSLKENEEQKAIFAAREVEFVTESARMLTKIRELEGRISTSFLKSSWRNILEMVGEFSSWITRLKERKQAVDVETL